MNALRAIVAFVVVGATGCAAGPNYRTPQPDTPPHFVANTSGQSAAGVDLAVWWKSLKDPELDSLVERAVKSNLDLEIALTRLQQARTYESVVVGHALPEVDASAAAARGTGSARPTTPGAGTICAAAPTTSPRRPPMRRCGCTKSKNTSGNWSARA